MRKLLFEKFGGRFRQYNTPPAGTPGAAPAGTGGDAGASGESGAGGGTPAGDSGSGSGAAAPPAGAQGDGKGASPAGTPPAGSPPDLNTPASKGDPNLEWRTTLDAEFQAHPSIKDVKTVNDLVKMTVNAQKLLGEKANAIVPLKADATPEQKAEFYKKLGCPDKIDGYEIACPDYGDKDMHNFSLGVLQKMGANKEQANIFMTEFNNAITAKIQEKEAIETKALKAAADDLKSGYQSEEELKADLESSKALIIAKGGQEAMDTLIAAGLGNNPVIQKMFIKLSRSFREDVANGSGNGSPSGVLLTPAQAKVAKKQEFPLDKFKKGTKEWNESKYQAVINKDHPLHESVLPRWNELVALEKAVVAKK